jgi:nucleoside phosphorylase
MAGATHPRESYNVGVICALDVEKAAIESTLDEEHGRIERVDGDDNVYTFGRIGEHNVVIACLPAGVMGKVSATAASRDMMRSFPIKVGLMVGVCGGVWSVKTDIRLGDVVVSQPDGMHGGVVQWDFGKMEKEGAFVRKGMLNRPPRPLLNAVQSLKARHRRKGNELHIRLEEILSNNEYMLEEYRCPGRQHDELFDASYNHPEGDTCDRCDRSRLVRRLPDRQDDKPKIHYGNIASGDEVVKDGRTRDRIAREEGILCFEMEAAGLMDTFPCVVIRGVCDYADSHKNKRWQPYAAMVAACYAKELLSVIDRQKLKELKVTSE